MDRNLITRIATGIGLLPVVLFAAYRGGWIYIVLVGLIALLGAWEWWRLARPDHSLTDLALLAVGALGAYQGAIDPRPVRLAIFLALFLVIVLLAALRRADGNAGRLTGHLILGALYVGLLPAFLVRLRMGPFGREALFAAYGAAFIGDSVAYFLGRSIGRRALWPRVSPHKTWEGAAGGLIGAIIGAFVGEAVVAGSMPASATLGFGIAVGTFGQMGDLVESLWKREAGVKDSSALIPGHGGVLDRFDNLHFAAPVLYTYLAIFV